MNALAKLNADRRREAEAFAEKHVARHQQETPPHLGDYPLPRLKARLAAALSERWGKGKLEPQIELISREQFGGDLTLKFPQLLSDGGPKGFAQKHLPWIVETLEGPAFAGDFSSVKTKGMYVNITLSDRWMLEATGVVAEMGDLFGKSDVERDRSVLIDYSSPNAAKVLHAGHIRSTIIGHVLGNLHEASGALVWRVNHVNDFGGFGFMLEGWRRFGGQFPEALTDNQRLLEIYRIRRTLERVAEPGATLDKLDETDRALLDRYFPEARDRDAILARSADYTARSDVRFAALEAGAAEEVDLWKEMVGWSLKDFDRFYDSLDIHIDLVLGESFYAQAAEALIDASLAAKTALVYGEAEAAADLAEVEALLAKGSITAAEREQRAGAIRKDVGAVVVSLGDGERLVVRRADGRSIYATRDLGAIALRRDLFHPTEMLYVVGQEQKVHFSRLFKAAYATGAADRERVSFKHVFFGFYVDAKTGKKLSSRDTVANVNHLLTAAVDYFRARSADRSTMTPDELESTARQLAVGSIVFNDLKQDVKGSVDIDVAALDATVEGFEKSGGAYVVYTACRARSILRKHGAAPPAAREIEPIAIDPQEAGLLLKIQQIPERIVAAAEQANPTVIVRHLLDIAGIYNSYYHRFQVISKTGEIDVPRLLFAKAVEQSLTNTLRVCHIECPSKI